MQQGALVVFGRLTAVGSAGTSAELAGLVLELLAEKFHHSPRERVLAFFLPKADKGCSDKGCWRSGWIGY